MNIKNHGFKLVKINGIDIYTCNIAIKRNESREYCYQIDGVNIYQSTKLMGKYKKEVPVFIIRYATADFKQHNKNKTAVMNLLESHAKEQVERKYAIMRGEYTPPVEVFNLENDDTFDLPY
jgi:hypothetical protein